MYQVRRASRSRFLPIRRLNYHLREWGESRPGEPPLVMVHGWMDVSASFQFMVDALARERHVIAPDWRGFGLTQTPGADHYVIADYLGDLDALLDALCGDAPVDLLGHSMGGNVVMLYAGVRPARIRKLINLEGFGMPATEPRQAGARYARWMDELKALARGELALNTYATWDGVAQRLTKTNPRLAPGHAAWLARHWARPVRQADGGERYEILGDAAHKIINANLYQLPETLALYADITAPLLAVEASDDSLSRWWKGAYTLAEYHERLKNVARHRVAVIQDAGHMLHHDQPEALAALVEAFLDE